MQRTPKHALSVLQRELRALRKLDSLNQARFAKLLLARRRPQLTRAQMFQLTEGLFFGAFRQYQQFLAETFLLYSTGKFKFGRKHVKSYLEPRDRKHAELLIQSSMTFLDWSSPETVLERAELYLKGGFPIKQALISHRELLIDAKRIRNHIAHLSKESRAAYHKTLKRHYSVIPLNAPRPGEFLLLPSRTAPDQYYLLYYFAMLETVAKQMVK